MKCDIEGVVIKELNQYDDSRGWLVEVFRQDEIKPEYFPVMAYISMTKPGIARGPHEHREQSDCFCFIGPSTFRLYLWDNRKNSSGFGRFFKADFGENRKALVIIPPGVVHAYKNVGSTEGLVYNAPNRLYAGAGRKEDVDEIRHEERADSKFRLID
jgi:dTDP-4-dehydrorhamnose 3,5-epimerase